MILGWARCATKSRPTTWRASTEPCYLLSLLATPANQAALNTAADTKAFADAQRQFSTFNTAQNSGLNTTLEFTDENIKAGNALWEYIVDVLGTGMLMYKETNPKKAKTYAMGTLLKRIRKESGTREVKPEKPL